MLSEQCQLALSATLAPRRREQSLPEGEVLHAWLLLCGDTPAPANGSGQPLLEELLPDIRLLAVLSAAQRCHFADGQPTASQS